MPAIQENSHFAPLPASLTIETVEALAAFFLEHKPSGQTALTLDVSPIEVITTPGVQLLVSLAKTLETLNVALNIEGARPAFAQTLQQLGLSAYFAQKEFTHE